MNKSVIMQHPIKSLITRHHVPEQEHQDTRVLKTQLSMGEGWFVPTFDYPDVPHATRTRFRNISKVPDREITVLEWLLNRQKAPWPIWEENIPYHALPVARPDADLSDWQAWFVGHSTVLVQIGPYHFLTDPVWAMRTSFVPFAGPRRVRPAGIALADLPRIDAILLSHNHYDHMDLASLNWLYQRDRMPIYAGLVNSQYLPSDMHVIELDWWQSIPFHKDDRLTITFSPAQHFSGRGIKDNNMALWGGLSVHTADDHFYFGGDTGYADHFKDVYTRLGAPRLALLPIGAYEPRGVMRAMHMNPADAVQAHLDLHATCSLAIHHRTYQLTDEAIHQPLLDLADAMARAGLKAEDFVAPLEGHMVQI